ncbi:uncharacterized protein LOC122500915 [Leptopilina heterotoma]|uniref:uncharacterized protein LOC122500915 n=1 Tax=Leptopilina heterotoma TaxID=63436 RepID=UPI001CA90F86|nr:uncharacterized protein LOC122500915 [Leptopilina heterotoma]
MNTTTLFIDPVQTVQFLTLVTYMNKLSDLFYAEELIKEEDKNQQFTIINTFYDYLNKSNNETELKEQIVRKLLEGSDLYGGQDNETLDMEYVNRTFDYIVSNTVFSQNGNIYGFLAEIVSTSKSLKLSVFRQTAFERLSCLRNINDDGNVSNLTQLTIGKIAENFLWPLLPNATHDMEVVSVKYLYALAGHKLSQLAQMNMSEVSFQKYVTLAMAMEASAIGDELPKSVLQIFALPALLYYAHKETSKISQQPMKQLIKDEDFWSNAFFTLFSFLNTTFETIRQEALASNSLYQFHLKMSKFKNRTVVARETLHKECSYLNDTYLESLIEDYKTYSSSTRCHKLAKLLPNLEQIYESQFSSIKEKYRLMELDFIRSAFDDLPLLKTLINSTGTIVYKASPKPNDMYCYLCPPTMPTFNPNIILFGVKGENQTVFFALEQNENNVTLILHRGEKIEFNTRIGLEKNVEVEVPLVRTRIKQPEESFDFFVEKIAEMKAEEFRKQLFGYGYDTTSMEKFFEILKAFIPFYHCIQYARAGEQGMATLTCIGDVVGLIPFVGVFNIGFKMSTMTINRFLLTAELSLRSYTLRQAILTTMTVGLRNTALELSGIFSKVIFTKQMFKAVSVGVIRTLDPGFELVGKLTTRGSVLIGKVISSAFKRLSKTFPTLNFKYAKFENLWLHLTGQGAKSADVKVVTVPGIESKEIGREVFRSIYPGGKEPFGPKYIQLSNGHAELRQMIGFENQIPVVISRVSKRGRIFYRRIDLKTEKPFGLELKINKNTQLENIRQPFRQHIYKIKTEGLGGKGALYIKKIRCIDEAVQVVVDARIGIGTRLIRKKMKHYVLSTDTPTTLDDLMDVEIINFNQNFDQNNEFHNLLGMYRSNPIDDVDLNNYLPVPTYAAFALDWVKTGTINPIYKQYYVEDVDELENLMFGKEVTAINGKRVKDPSAKIVGLYGQHYIDNLNLDLNDIVNEYFSRSLWKHVNLEDFFALRNWKLREYVRLTDDSIVTDLLHKSLLRLAVRQSTQESLPKVLYHIEMRDRVPIESHSSQIVEKFITSNSYIASSTEEVQMFKIFSDVIKKLPASDLKQIFVYKSFIDSSYLTVDLKEVLPVGNPITVILPETRFQVKHVEEKIIEGFNVLYFEVVNVPIAREIVISRLMNEILKLDTKYSFE